MTHEKKHLPRPVLIEAKPPRRTIGFERKPVVDTRRIEIDGIHPFTDYKLRQDDERLRD